MTESISKWERTAAIVFSVVLILLHLIAATSAGGLWRDEANTVGLATLPTIGDVWRNLQYDSFPILWLLIVRWYSVMFGATNDVAFRCLGFFIGTGIVGALWFNARTFRRGIPLFSLVTLGMAPSLITWGDSMRASGFGILLILVTCAFLWRFLAQANLQRFLVAAIAALASVQTTFYNAVLLLAFCAGAGAVCARKGEWKKAAYVVLIGVIAAISLIPYITTISRASTWNALVRIPDYGIGWFFASIKEALAPGGAWGLLLWAELLIVAVFVALRSLRSAERLGLPDSQRDVPLFTLASIGVGTVSYFVFLKLLSYPTEAWYYLSLLALVGLCMDTIFGTCIRRPGARIARLTVVSIIALATIVPTTRAVRMRLTNADLISSRLMLAARPSDLVIVNPWHYGVSFDRYYHGPAAWTTSPSVGFHRFHRYDLIKQLMLESDQTLVLSPVLKQAEKTLRNGKRVFVVCDSTGLLINQIPIALPPAPLPGSLWWINPYNEQWSAILGYFLRQHAVSLSRASMKTRTPVSDYENLGLLVASGWRD